MKKVLFVIHTLGIGGAEKVLVNLANRLVDNYDVTVMTIINTGGFRNNLSDKITYKSVFSFGENRKKCASNISNERPGSLLTNKSGTIKKVLIYLYQFIWKIMPVRLLHKIVIKENYDIEVAFLEGITSKFVSGNINEETMKIAWIHVDLLNERKSEKVFLNFKKEKKCYENFDKIICVSENVRDSFISKFDYNNEKVLVKYNPIDNQDIKNKSQKIDFKLEKNTFNIITVGRLSSQKGYDRLLRIVKKLNKDGFKYNLYIIGIGPEYKTLKDYKEYNNLDNVYFLGYQSNPYSIIKQADLFVCSSRAEGFSTVVTEASILNVPTITTLCSGMKELFGENEYGIIVNNDETALYDGLKYVLNNINILGYYKEKLKFLEKRFDLEISVTEVEALFNDI